MGTDITRRELIDYCLALPAPPTRISRLIMERLIMLQSKMNMRFHEVSFVSKFGNFIVNPNYLY